MDALIESIWGIGPLATSVFNEAGLHTVRELTAFDGHDLVLHEALRRIREADENRRAVIEANDIYWRKLYTRCVNVIIRLRNREEISVVIVPDAFMCIFTLDYFEDPVVTPSGHSYSRVPLARWLRENSERHPVCGTTLKMIDCYANISLRQAIEHHKQSSLEYTI
jgi:hypothetical protein